MFIFLFQGSDYRVLWGPDSNILVAVSHLLITISCSSNFAIYCFLVSTSKIDFLRKKQPKYLIDFDRFLVVISDRQVSQVLLVSSDLW